MLNAELKSMNSILKCKSFLSRCVRAGVEGSCDGVIGPSGWTDVQTGRGPGRGGGHT